MTRLLSLLLAVVFAASSLARAAENDARLEILPAEVELSGARDRQSIIVLQHRADGSTQDVTAEATVKIDPPVASISRGFLAPKADGQGQLTASVSALSAQATIRVARASAAEPLGFRNDVLPVLTRFGCNTGKCHGAAVGKDGFRLSLFGYDPDGDYYRLTRELPGRRINLADPTNSLLINKAAGKVPHTGGERFDDQSEAWALIVRWLEDGAPGDSADTARPLGLEVFPREVVFASAGEQQRLVVRAKYSDGSDRDVTRFAVFVGNNDGAAQVSETGIVTANAAGEAFILARFDEFTQGSAIIVRPAGAFVSPATPEANYIDRYVHDKLNKLHEVSSELCSDEVFLRRAYIDLIGLLPTPAERQVFLADPSARKREQLVDMLLAREEFVDLWVMHWAELLQIRANNGMSEKGLVLYESWLRERVRSGATIDQILLELLPAQGSTFETPAVNYFQNETSPQLLAENVAQVFLGTRIQCAQCHNHPFDRWTMNDYYGFAAFFKQVGYKNGQDPRELIIFNAGSGTMRHPVSGNAVAPKFLGGEAANLAAAKDHRAALADWLAGQGNEAFRRNFANIVWAHFLGRGIVEPVDDSRISNPASDPELLAELGRKASEYRFDVRKLARDICLSRTYQLSTQPNETNVHDSRNFARQSVRRIRAEVLLDCINMVTESSSSFAGLPLGGRAVQVPGGRSLDYFLTTFGRSSRETPCSCEVKTSPTLSQALHLLNGDTVSGKIVEGRVVDKLLATGQSPTDVAGELYRRCFCRVPTEVEAARIAEQLSHEPNQQQALEDLFWALLNSNEFIFNH